MRVVKEAEERKNEILDAADELFIQKGFNGTSTNDILEKVGIARGTLYYHFKSKEEIMDALIARYNARLLSAAQEIAAEKSIPVKERILHVVLALNLTGSGGEEIMEHIHKPQNALMHQKIQKRNSRTCVNFTKFLATFTEIRNLSVMPWEKNFVQVLR